ncbi:hypothetical protein M8R20_16905 [Pseudomonas sp. R2.Fl]|nr:hypothetical protein [Pseudomonas sp. R2.Fl]
MTKLLYAVAVLATAFLFVGQAAAAGFYDPPARFRGESETPMDVHRLDVQALQKACGNNRLYPVKVLYGCAFHLKHPDRCAIFIPNRTMLNVGFPVGPLQVSPQAILRHEKGHCAGWPADHHR